MSQGNGNEDLLPTVYSMQLVLPSGLTREEQKRHLTAALFASGWVMVMGAGGLLGSVFGAQPDSIATANTETSIRTLRMMNLLALPLLPLCLSISRR